MPRYRLLYFNARGRAEVARYMMAIGNIEYEDVRYSREEWQDIKPTMPYEELPVLEVDGVKIAQSRAIFRYLAKQAGLTGTSDLEDAQIDMMVECVDEMLDFLITIFRENDETRKEEIRTKVANEKLPESLRKIEKLLAANDGGNGYLVGKTMTWADIVLAASTGWPAYAGIKLNMEELCPKIMALEKRVMAHPKIAEWVEKRPKTER